MRNSDWSSDVCSSDVLRFSGVGEGSNCCKGLGIARRSTAGLGAGAGLQHPRALAAVLHRERSGADLSGMGAVYSRRRFDATTCRSEEHTYALPSLMRISYAVFCLKKKTNTNH